MPIFECKRCNELSYSAAPDYAGACRRCGSESRRTLYASDPAGARRALEPCDHVALVYEDPALVAFFCARYLTAGIDNGERVLATAPDDLRAAIEPLVPADVNVLVEWRHPREVYGDFDRGRVAAMYDRLIAGEPRRVRILGVVERECADGTDPAELDRYEAQAHEIMNRHGALALCLYDARVLGEDYLQAAARRHPLTIVDGEVRRNDAFEYATA